MSKQHCYITGRSTHHHTNKPMNINALDTPPSTSKWERRPNQAADTCAVVTNVVPRRGATRCKHQKLPKLLHHGTVILKLHMSACRSLRSKKASAHTPTTSPGTPTDPGHSAWGPRLTHRLSLPRTQVITAAKGASPPPCRH
jgi:hypothetical protein